MFTVRTVMGSLLFLAFSTVAFAVAMPSNTLYLGAAGRGASAQEALTAHRTRMTATVQAQERLKAYLIRHGFASRRTIMPRFDTLVVEGAPGRSLPATRATRYGNGQLTFQIGAGWTDGERSALQSYLSQAYDTLVLIYGAPATTATLTIDKGDILAAEGGEFYPESMRLVIGALPEDFQTGDSTHYGKNLLHLVLHAFHAPVLIGVDAWEEGMARAAAAIAAMRLSFAFDLSIEYDYLLPIYDLANQQALASPTISVMNSAITMADWRMGMAQAAWMKAYTDRIDFNGLSPVFRDFNAQYYTQVATNPSLAGDVSGLTNVMASVEPTVEGVAFASWYAHQYALQTTKVLGERMYVLMTPLQVHANLLVHYFRTNIDGSETPLSGAAKVDYSGFDGIPLSPEEGNDLVINATNIDAPGTGTLSPSFYNIGMDEFGRLNQRVRIAVSLNGMENVMYYPYYCLGEGATDNDDGNVYEFSGSVIGVNSGDMTIAFGNRTLQTPIVQGAFALQATADELGLRYFIPVTYSFTANGKAFTFTRNAGPWRYVAVLDAGGGPIQLTHTFFSGLSLISFPLAPQETDTARIFFPAGKDDFQFAWYDPNPELIGDRYRQYPGSPAIDVGKGYWVNLPAVTTVNVLGTPLSENDPRTIVLQKGWNLIGNTYNAKLDPWAMRVQAGTTSYSLHDAIMTGGIIGPVWSYNSISGYEVNRELQPWEGGWIYNATGGVLTLRQQGATRARSKAVDATRLLTDGGWGIALRAVAGAAQDTMAFLGVNSHAKSGLDGLDWVKPPSAPDGGVRVAFINPASRTAGAQYATDMRPEISQTGEVWDFTVTSTTRDQVNLTWPDLRGVPEKYQPILEDTATGTRQYLRTTAAYSYTANGSPEQPDVRQFRLIIEPRSNVRPQFISVKSVATRGNGASVLVTLSAPADLIMEVRTPAGKLVRTLRVPASRANDPVVIPWDGRGTDGKLAPSNTYMIFLTARTADGFVIRRGELMRVGRH